MIQMISHALKVCAGVLLVSSVANAGVITTWSGNGHDYQLVQGNMTWEQANDALDDGWHLATITSAAEQSFIQTTFASYVGEFWLGGYQQEDGLSKAQRIAGAADNWAWVTGESWGDFSNWKRGEPNEYRGKREDHLGIWNNGRQWNWHWNDEHGKSNIRGYIAERGAIAVPEPSSLSLMALGLLGVGAIRKMS